VRYGFVIDQRKCIGCHACTVACKEENQVPLGAFRTWVKYVERGTFPHTRRYFSVLRCNHCDNAPCVTICPTVALYRRPDGIVDFDGARCIGCKSCLQACPYDALYIDPSTQTAAKCHYCAHRIEVGLEPACVIVCPEQAIVAGDLDDPTSRIARLVATEPVQVRKAEQGTRPKVFYLGADTSALTPSLQTPTERYAWAERPSEELSLVNMVASLPDSGHLGDGARSRPVYDVPHMPRPWGWKVSAYLWTKSIAAGTTLVGTLALSGALATQVAPLLSLVFLALTTALLILDLKRPERFLYILVKPNWRSWLVWGAFILIAFGVVVGLSLLVTLDGKAVPWPLGLAAVLLALAAAGYSAFLFGQAEGRDFWQTSLKLPHLIVASLVAGSATLLFVVPGWHFSTAPDFVSGGWAARPPFHALGPLLFVALLAHAAFVLMELFSRHPGYEAAAAARLLTRGRWGRRLWGGVVAAGIVAPLALLMAGAASQSAVPTSLSALLSLAGLWIYEDLWVQAGQSIPLS
jgi:Fe-S-cluster-containing dehydrogenase component/formate-dependent nitrite reductase membrane component NrfD